MFSAPTPEGDYAACVLDFALVLCDPANNHAHIPENRHGARTT
jgi:hypothetical protein